MKKAMIAIAVVSMVLVGFGSVSAQMVDIGTGQMEAADFIRLKAMVQGQPVVEAATVSTTRVPAERYGLLEMSSVDFEALRNKVAGIEDGRNSSPAATVAVRMVDIGTGEMPADEFAVLQHMIRKPDYPVFDGLAFLRR